MGSLVVLKGDGTLVTKGGRGDVSNHGKKALEFWSQTAIDLLKDQHFIKTDDSKVAAQTVIEGKKFVGFYFSAHWCPPCRGFTPVLKDFYEEVSDEVEIIFVSSDRSSDDMQSYMKESHGSWLSVEHGSALAQSLKDHFGVSGIPGLATDSNSICLLFIKKLEKTRRCSGEFRYFT